MGDRCFDYIVVGAGIVGTWSAYHLSKRGYKVLLVDQFPLPHTRGSSHGTTRGIRKAYFESVYAQMMSDAYQQWRILEEESGVGLIRTTGLLTLGPKNETMVQQMVDAFKATPGSRYEYLSSAELSRRYTNVLTESACNNSIGCFDPEAGLIFADKALLALWDVAKRKYGCTIIDACPVAEIIPGANRQFGKHSNLPNLCMVVCRNGTAYECKKVIVCAGPWTKYITDNLGWSLPLRPLRITVCFFKADKHHFNHNFIFDSENESQHIWGLSEYEYPGMIKICRHDGVEVDPDQRDYGIEKDMANDIRILETFIAKYFLCVQTKPSIQESCIYTVTPDEVHILDTHPKYDDIVVGCGFSGTGFKLGPVTGEMLADIAVGNQTKFEHKPFRASRFENERSSISKALEKTDRSRL